jgi:hypothetical protein
MFDWMMYPPFRWYSSKPEEEKKIIGGYWSDIDEQTKAALAQAGATCTSVEPHHTPQYHVVFPDGTIAGVPMKTFALVRYYAHICKNGMVFVHGEASCRLYLADEEETALALKHASEE